MSGNKDNEERVRLVVIGKTGSGKSSLANMLLGKKGRFKCGAFGSSVTTTTEADEGDCNGSSVKVVDTPGYFDTKVSDEDSITEIIQCLMLSKPGPHIFCYCINMRVRFTEEDAETFRKVKMSFGDSVTDYMRIVFTNKDCLEEERYSEKKCIELAPSALKDVLKEVRYKPVFINNKSPNIETELEPMSTIIKGVKFDSYFDDVKYRSTIKILTRLVKVEGEYKAAYEKWKNKREEIVKCFSLWEFDQKNMVKRVRISKISGSVAGIVGTTMTIVGVVAAPLTLGTSLIVTAVGAGIGIAGGVTGGGATVADLVISKQRKKEMDALLQDDRKLLEKLGDEEVKFYKVLFEIFNNNEMKCVIQNVLKKTIARSSNETFENEVRKGLDEARDYLLQFLNAENKYLEPVEIDTGHDTSLGAANAAATAGGQVAKTVAVATDTTTDIVGSVAASTATAIRVTAIAGLVLSAITLPLDVYTIFRSSSDLHSNKEHHLEKIIRDFRIKLENNMKDYDNDRDVFNIFVEEIEKFQHFRNVGH
ncbi:hypothetical protein SNE40_010781 [Patella caerulea]|uniref:AIG1-type G domain-containing protein n=1 Tax=Patella caerulea TaxID=87958 RepID=A0AAN8Q5G8_PATCE